MIPRLNTCPRCNERGPDASPMVQDFEALHRALHDLLFTVAEALRIDRVAAWLSKRLP